MRSSKAHILIFGGGILQKSLITKCKLVGLVTVVIDPNPSAFAKDDADFFEVVGGADFEGTCAIVEQYAIQGIITSATDKPLVMMARIAERYNFPFYGIDTAKITTNKAEMKRVFLQNDIPCAHGHLISTTDEITHYPAILKPTDNSGSRGVFFCDSSANSQALLEKCFMHTKQESILCEEVLKGQEYSVEAIHQNGQSRVVQVTEKLTSAFPTNVELGHIAPANISPELFQRIQVLIAQISSAFSFNHCVSHTEIMVKGDTVKIIETSPRLGGDFITSHLVPLSTGLDIETALISLAMGEAIEEKITQQHHVGIFYFVLPVGKVQKLPDIVDLKQAYSIHHIELQLALGDHIPVIENSLNRYGHFILQSSTRQSLISVKERILESVKAQTAIK